MMKKRIALIAAALLLLSICCLTGCSTNISKNDCTRPEEPHLYWKDIEVVVTDIDARSWLANVYGYRVYKVTITVYSEEYQLEKTIEITGGGAAGKPQQYDYQVGDSVQAQLYSWVMDSTGEIIRRDINKIY